MNRPHWVKAVPTKLGLYWMVFRGGTRAHVCALANVDDEDTICFYLPGDEEPHSIEDIEWWWSEPLQSPELP